MNSNDGALATTLVVTSIHAPGRAMRSLAAGCRAWGWDFVVAGDGKSPADFALEGCRFLSLAAQRDSGFALGRVAPERTYTRKNLAYLTAMRDGAQVIVETDDDNHPRPEFWAERTRWVACQVVEADAWVNAYLHFSDAFIYPRGLPLCHARERLPALGPSRTIVCPLQQGLADCDPDVDAVYRMLFPLPLDFCSGRTALLLRGGAWCPFNSQNTTFFQEVFPLLYLPARCSFRMTDIWRSFVAQRVLQAMGYGVLFHGATVWQERNEHNLQQDFMDEMPGYVHNLAMREALLELPLRSTDSLRTMIESCYQVLIRRGWVGGDEEPLLNAWFADLDAIAVV